jgi:probable F420-dependent oxidoreductase
MTLGVTIPFTSPLSDQGEIAHDLVQGGFSSLWTAETAGADAFSPLLLASTAPDVRLGTAVASVYARSPALLAMNSAALAESAPGRVSIGLGASSAGMVEGWHDRSFERPYQRVVDTCRFLRSALAGERVTEQYPTFSIRGFTLERPPAEPPAILIAALQAKMLAAAGRESDGVILNWLGPADVETVARHVHDARPAGADPATVVARIFVCPTDDPATTRRAAKSFLARYLTVPVYERYHRWLGRGDALEQMWTLWADRDRSGAADSIPDQVVDDLIGIGDTAACAAHIASYVHHGVTEPVVKVLPLVDDLDPCAASLEIAAAYRSQESTP